MATARIAPEWDPPVLEQSIDADFYIRSCPSYATTPGLFMQDIVKLVTAKHRGATDRLHEGVTQRRWIAFKFYPLRDWMRLAINATKILDESVPLSEGLRRLGRIAFPSLGGTMAGKVVLYALGNRIEDAFRNAPRAYKMVLPESEVTVDVGEGRGRIDLRNIYSFPSAYHYGVFEGTVAEYGFQPRIRLLPGGRWCDASFEADWH